MSDRIHRLRVAWAQLLYRLEQHFSDTWDGSMDPELDLHDAQRKRNELTAHMAEARLRGRNVVGMIEKRPPR